MLKNSLPLFVLSYITGLYFLTLVVIGNIPFYVIAVSVLIGMVIEVDIGEDLKIDAALSRIFYTTAIVGVITHNLFAEISLNQFIFVLVVIHFTSKLLFNRSEFLRSTLNVYERE